MKTDIDRLTQDVALYMGDSLILECESAESPLPDLRQRVSLLAPGILAEIIGNMEVPPLEMRKPLSGTLSVDSDGIGTLILPDDYMRLICVKAGSWKIPAEVLTTGDRMARLRSKWAGIRGTSLDPIASECFDPSGKLCLKLSPCSQNSETVSGQYLPRPSAENLESINIPPLLYLQLIEKTAAKLNPT